MIWVTREALFPLLRAVQDGRYGEGYLVPSTVVETNGFFAPPQARRRHRPRADIAKESICERAAVLIVRLKLQPRIRMAAHLNTHTRLSSRIHIAEWTNTVGTYM